MNFAAAILSTLVMTNSVDVGMIAKTKPDLDLGTGYLNASYTLLKDKGADKPDAVREASKSVMIFVPKGKKPERKLNAWSHGKILELSLDDSLSFGTNATYRVQREFPVMFRTPSVKRREK